MSVFFSKNLVTTRMVLLLFRNFLVWCYISQTSDHWPMIPHYTHGWYYVESSCFGLIRIMWHCEEYTNTSFLRLTCIITWIKYITLQKLSSFD